MTLREFLLENAPAVEKEKQRQQARDEWIAAVNQLLAQMRDWLKEAGALELLDIRPLEFERREEKLGAYEVPGLDIHFGDRTVKVEPVARAVLAPAGLYTEPGQQRAGGRVDITNDSYDKYFLYRKLTRDGDQWVVQLNRPVFRPLAGEQSDLRPLDKELFEAILKDLLA